MLNIRSTRENSISGMLITNSRNYDFRSAYRTFRTRSPHRHSLPIRPDPRYGSGEPPRPTTTGSTSSSSGPTPLWSCAPYGPARPVPGTSTRPKFPSRGSPTAPRMPRSASRSCLDPFPRLIVPSELGRSTQPCGVRDPPTEALTG
jgi:hypothetical protein